jgi:putative membrane protein
MLPRVVPRRRSTPPPAQHFARGIGIEVAVLPSQSCRIDMARFLWAREEHMTRFLTTAVLVLAATQVGYSADRGATARAVSDEDFLIKAVASGVREVKFSELAEKQAANADVKNFAAQLVKDHNDANKELLSRAKGLKIAVITGLDKDKRTAYTNLGKLSGDDFDREYMRMMVEDHEKAVSLFRDYSTAGKNDDLRQFATKTLPTLKHHLEEARNLFAKLKK